MAPAVRDLKAQYTTRKFVEDYVFSAFVYTVQRQYLCSDLGMRVKRSGFPIPWSWKKSVFGLTQTS
jgi:hypothetical protein